MKQQNKRSQAPTNGNHRESELGRKLRKISEEYEAKGGRLLSPEEVEREVAERRGAA
jgi:hypothetical protein